MGDRPVIDPSADPAGGSPPWWWRMPPLQADVECGGARHRVRWTDGELELPDHGDPVRERALGALAGQRPGCLRLYDAWHRHSADPTVLVMAGRGAADPLYVPGSAHGSARGPGGGTATVGMAPQPGAVGWTAYSPMPAVYQGRMPRPGPRGPGPASADAPDDDLDLLWLLGLGAQWSDRLSATVIAALLDAAEPGAEPPAELRAALYGRALAVLRGWLGRPELDIDLTIAPDPAAATLDLAASPVRAALPVRWLLDVWARGLTVVWGRFCLAAMPDRHNGVQLVTIDPDGTRSTVIVGSAQPQSHSCT